jgi:glycosyltransferase involved in cell wall biosynthesis
LNKLETENMKILLASGAAYPRIGGVENSLIFMGRELLRAGHEVKIFCFQTLPDEPLCMEHEGIEIIRVPFLPVRWPHAQHLRAVETAQRGIQHVLEEFRPHAIWSRYDAVSLGILRSGYKGRLIHVFCTNARMQCRGTYLQTHGFPLKRRIRRMLIWPSVYFVFSRLERELVRRCESVVFSENMRKQLLDRYSKEICSCHMIPPGVDSDLFSPENGSRYFHIIESRYGLSRSEPIVLYVGRLESEKQIPMLMDAVASLPNRTKLVLVGSGAEEKRLVQYAKKIGFSDQLLFAGSQREMLPGFYAISRVCVLPTTTESFGQVLLESLASGTPAIGFAGDGRKILTATNEIIRDGQTGAVANKVNATALAEKIDSILSLDENDYNSMSQRARHDVCERFSWERFVTCVLALSGTIARAEAECST